MKPLYEIANKYQELMAQVMECDELSIEQLANIESIDGNLQEKAINIGALVKNLEVQQDGIEKAISSMNERSIKIQSKINHLKEYLKVNLERCEIKEVNSPYFDIKIKLNPASVIIKDEQLIPDQYFREILTKRVDKMLLSKELKNNIMIPGVSLERQTRLEIK